MMDEQKFQAFKRRAVEENEKRYGAEIRQTYGDQEMDQANASVMGLTQEQYRQWESLGQEIRSKLRQAVEWVTPHRERKGRSWRLSIAAGLRSPEISMMWTGIRDWPNYMWQMSGLPLTMTERQMDVHSSCEMPSCIGQVSCKEKEAGARSIRGPPP